MDAILFVNENPIIITCLQLIIDIKGVDKAISEQGLAIDVIILLLYE